MTPFRKWIRTLFLTLFNSFSISLPILSYPILSNYCSSYPANVIKQYLTAQRFHRDSEKWDKLLCIMTYCPAQDVLPNHYSIPPTSASETAGPIGRPQSDRQQLEIQPQHMQSFPQPPLAVFSPMLSLESSLETMDPYHLGTQIGSLDQTFEKSAQHFQGEFGMLGALSPDWMPQSCSSNVEESRVVPWIDLSINQPGKSMIKILM